MQGIEIGGSEREPEYLEVAGNPSMLACSWCGAAIPKWDGPMPTGYATPDRVHTDWHRIHREQHLH